MRKENILNGGVITLDITKRAQDGERKSKRTTKTSMCPVWFSLTSFRLFSLFSQFFFFYQELAQAIHFFTEKNFLCAFYSARKGTELSDLKVERRKKYKSKNNLPKYRARSVPKNTYLLHCELLNIRQKGIAQGLQRQVVKAAL